MPNLVELELERQRIAERNRLILDHQGLVFLMLKRLRLADHPQAADLIQEGLLALLRAVELFRPEEGVRFSSYACRAIRARMVQAAGRARRFPRTLSFLADQDSDRQVGPPDEAQAEETEARRKAEWQRQALEAALAQLRPRWAHVIRARFFAGRTVGELAAELGVSRQRVRQMGVNALTRLREHKPELADLLAA